MDILFIFGLLVIAIIVSDRFAQRIPDNYKLGIWIMLAMHICTAVGYYFVTRNGGGDAWGYWAEGKGLNLPRAMALLFDAKGTHFIYGFNYFFSGFLKLGFFANTCVYAFLGYLGLLYFYRIVIEQVPVNSFFLYIKLFPFLFFLPMLHFWSSGIGKDALLFLCIAIFTYAMLDIPKRFLAAVFALLFAYLARPHIGLLLVFAFAIAYLVDNKTTTWRRIAIGVAMLVVAAVMVPAVLEYVKIDEISVQSISSFSKSKAEALSRSHTGSSIDISSYPLPVKWFTFLFRPLFFDANDIPMLLASFENLFLLLLFIKVLSYRPLSTFLEAPFVVKGLVLFLILGVLLLSGSLGNLGIAIRMRNMFLPGMMIYFLWALSYAHTAKSSSSR